METGSVLEELSASVRKEADVLLYEIGLAPLLSGYGELYPTGSYAMDVMTCEDLDLYLDMAHVDKGRMYEMVHEMALLLHPFWLEAKSMLDNPEPDFPRGYFIGMETRIIGSRVWNIDLIVMSLQDILRAQSEVAQRKQALDPAMRRVVLELKTNPRYRKEFYGTDVYDAVIQGSVRSVEELKCWLKTKVRTGMNNELSSSD